MPAPPSGDQHAITAGDLSAVVTQVGAALRSLTAAGRDLVVPFDAAAPQRLYRGAVLAPWPNRTGDGRYTWDGAEQQLALTEPERGCALHGLVVWQPWALAERTASSVALTTRVWAQAGYPHQLDLRATCALTADGPGRGLTWTLEAVNTGATAAPWGCSVHPYLVAGPGRVDDWTLELDAARVLDVDPDRLLPTGGGTGTSPVDGTALDFRGGRSLAGAAVDHALTGLSGGTAVVRAADGSGVALHFDPGATPWVQVHTADRPEPADDRVGLAVEPMTCPPDALRSGTDLQRLEPGASASAWWRIEPVGPRWAAGAAA